MKAVWPIIAAATVCMIAVILVRGLDREQRFSGTNLVEVLGPTVTMRDGELHCQEDFLPGNTAAIQLVLATDGKPVPPVEVTVSETSGKLIARNRVGGWPTDGYQPLPLGRTIERPMALASICVRPRGGKLALGGFENTARVEFLRPDSESYAGMAGTISHRFGLSKASWMGAWTFWLAFALMAAVWVLVVRLILREVRD